MCERPRETGDDSIKLGLHTDGKGLEPIFASLLVQCLSLSPTYNEKDFEVNQPPHHVILLDGRSSLHSWNACEVKKNWDHPAIMALCVSDILYVFQFHATWQDHKFIWMCACHIPRRISFLKFLITAITSSPREMSSALKGIYRGPWHCALLPVRWEGFWVTSTVISGDCKAVGAALKSHCTCQSSALTDSVRTDVKQNRATDMRGEYQSLSQEGKWRSFVQVQLWDVLFCLVMTLWFAVWLTVKAAEWMKYKILEFTDSQGGLCFW